MFYYGGEWYWGIDRLYHLEQRLADLGADRLPDTAVIMPKQEVKAGQLRDNGSLTLEVFASVRSPYTAMIFDRALELAETTGVSVASTSDFADGNAWCFCYQREGHLYF